MTFLGKAFGVAACVLMVACGSSGPESPLILGGEKDTVPGMRTLTPSQARALLDVIESAGEPCDSVLQTYLREANDGTDVALESWDVRCIDGAYAVMITDDGTPASVRRCPARYGGVPCVQRDRGFQRTRGTWREPDGTPALNPELGKLLEPMTSKDAKVD